MPIEVQGPDGSIAEFPDGTPDDVIKSVMAKSYGAPEQAAKAPAKTPVAGTGETEMGGSRAWIDGKRTINTRWGDYSTQFEVPSDWTREQVAKEARRRLASDNPNVQFPDEGAFLSSVKEKDFGSTLVKSAKDVASNVASGFYALPDMLNSAGNEIGNALVNAGQFLVTGGGASSGTVGTPSGSDQMAQGMNALRPRGDSFNSLIEASNPGFQNSPTALPAQFVGGAMIPIPGPKAAPASFPNALAKQAAPKMSAAAEIVNAGKQNGVRVMTSDVKPPQTIIGKFARNVGENIPFAGTSGTRVAQQAERADAASRFAQEYGVTGEAGAIDDVAANLAKTRGAEVQALTKRKDAIIDGLKGAVPVGRTVAAIDKQIARLQKMGTTGANAIIDKLQNWRQAIHVEAQQVDTGILDASGTKITRTVIPKSKSLRTIDDIRREMGQAFTGQEAGSIRDMGEKALSAIYGPMRDDMVEFISRTGGKNQASIFTAANKRLSAMAGELKVGSLKKALNTADATPENVSSLLFSAKPSDVRRLYAGLSKDGRVRAQAAILDKAVEKAGGLENISPDKFANEIDRLGKSVGVFFQGGDLARIEGFSRLIQMTKRAAQANIDPPTGAKLMPWATAGGFASLGPIKGILAAVSVGGLARIYESAPVRDALLKLSRAPAGSKAEAMLMERAAVAIDAVAARNPSFFAFANDNVGAAAVASDGQEQQQEQ